MSDKSGLPWQEATSKAARKFWSPEHAQEIKAWRTAEADAGRPSSYADFFHAHGFCVACLGEGVKRNENGLGWKVVGMDSDTQLFEHCPVCGGTGKGPSLA